jgi:hypothetical protein
VSEFEQLLLESPRCWLNRLENMDTANLLPEQRRVHGYYLANARRLLEEERQKAKWQRER